MKFSIVNIFLANDDIRRRVANQQGRTVNLVSMQATVHSVFLKRNDPRFIIASDSSWSLFAVKLPMHAILFKRDRNGSTADMAVDQRGSLAWKPVQLLVYPVHFFKDNTGIQIDFLCQSSRHDKNTVNMPYI